MANSVSKSGKGLGNLTPSKKPWLAIVSGIVGVLLLISLIDYNPSNYHSVPPSGSSPLLGKIGVVLARYLFGLFGLSAWLLPWMLATISFLAATKSATKEKVRKISTIAVAIVTIGVLANIRDHSLISDGEQTIFPSNAYEHGAGGSIGAILYSGLPIQAASDDSFGGFLSVWMGALGTSILMVCLLTGCICIHFSMEPLKFVAALVGIGKKVKDKIPENLGAKKSPETEQEQSADNDVKTTKNKESKKTWRFPWFGKRSEDDLLFGDVSLQKSSTEPNDSASASEKKAKTEGKIEKSLPEEELLEQNEPEEPDAPVADESPSAKDELAKEEETQAEVDPTEGMDGFKIVRAAKPEKAVDLFPERKGDYHFPPLDLLMDPPAEESSADEDHMIKAKRLKETLSQFKIEVEMGEVHTGPVITRYDVHPAPGVKVEKIANLDKNLAMALKADSVRILAPVPGKGCVGIEVPNAKPATVCLKEILQSKAWVEAGAEIPIVLGKEASGRPLVADLTKMPHLLVAGSTGSGKTVCINAVVASLCYYSSPEDVRFIMVEPEDRRDEGIQRPSPYAHTCCYRSKESSWRSQMALD